MSRNKKKKRFSRKFRKLHNIGKPSTVMVQGKPIITNKTEIVSNQDEKELSTHEDVSDSSEPNETREAVSQKKSFKDAVIIPFDEVKSKEIIGNLKTIMIISAICLLILGILYYFELRNDWVAMINTKIDSIMESWTW